VLIVVRRVLIVHRHAPIIVARRVVIRRGRRKR
jgi:hypothetical protein